MKFMENLKIVFIGEFEVKRDSNLAFFVLMKLVLMTFKVISVARGYNLPKSWVICFSDCI